MARTTLRLPEAETFMADELVKVRVIPFDMHLPRELEGIFKEHKEPAAESFVDKPAIARQV